MKNHSRVRSILCVSILLFSFCGGPKTLDQQLAEFFDNEEVTILVTDSGLGGLSVAADVAARLPKSGVFEKARIVFFNSLFHNRSGYNSLDSEAEKVRIFDTALDAMRKKYDPDLLLIACNTLSVLYDKTRFAKRAKFPVLGIVETGVDLIAQQFDQTPEATAIIFATKTTIGSNSHKNRLVSRGYPADQIVGQACHRLAGAIERGFDSEETMQYVREFVPQALEKKMDANRPVFASLNCTHFGYSIEQFRQVFENAGYPNIEIIDPNPQMADFLFESKHLNHYPETQVTIEVVSKTNVSEQERASLGTLLHITSPKTDAAFQNYRLDPDLFDAKFDTTKIGI